MSVDLGDLLNELAPARVTAYPLMQITKDHGETFIPLISVFDQIEAKAATEFMTIAFEDKCTRPVYSMSVCSSKFTKTLASRILSALPPAIIVNGVPAKIIGLSDNIRAIKVNCGQRLQFSDIYAKVNGSPEPAAWLVWNLNATKDKIFFNLPNGEREKRYLSPRDMLLTTLPFNYSVSDREDRYQIFVRVDYILPRTAIDANGARSQPGAGEGEQAQSHP